MENSSASQMHNNATPQVEQCSNGSSAVKSSSNNNTALFGVSSNTSNVVLLGTALVHLSTSSGQTTVARAVLDSAAQQTFITEACAHSLGLCNSLNSGTKIRGISSVVTSTKGLCNLNISSLSGHVIAESHPVLILDNITSHLPSCRVSNSVKERMRGLVLADPTFGTPAPID